MSKSSSENNPYTTSFGRTIEPTNKFTFPPGHGDNMATERTNKRHQEIRNQYKKIKKSCSNQVELDSIVNANKNLNNQLEKYNEMNTVQLIDKLNELNDQLGKLKVNGGGQKGGMINEDEDEDISLLESIALIMSFANITEQALEGASDIMYKILNVFEYAMNLMTNNRSCLQDYLNMVLGNTLTQLLQGTLFIQILMHAPAMLPQIFAQLINLIGKIAPYLLGSGSFLAQGIIGSIALTMVKYYINIAGEGLKKTNDTVTEAANNIKDIVEMPAEQVIENTAQAIKATKEAIEYIRDNQEKMKAAIEEEQKETQQKITIDLRLGIIETLMRKLNNEKADLIKEGSGDGTEFKELEKQYGDLMEERDSLEEELNNGKEEAAPGQKAAASTRVKRGAEEGPKEGAKAQKIEAPAAGEAVAEEDMDVAAGPGDNLGGGTRKKRTSRKGKKKASKNRKTKARRARKSRKAKK